ncbi:MAG: hypothetical protein P8075_19055 [Deltaproteobacteria bacterium]|jgi:hypothetical protein
MASHAKVHHRVEGIVAKLYVLRDSCTGIIHTEKSNPNLIWFQGAENLLQDAVDELQGALAVLETFEEGEPAAVEEKEEETTTAGVEEEEEAPADESD